MTENQENNYSMKLAVQQVLNDNAAIWTPNTGFAAIKTAFSDKLTDIYNKDQLQIAINTGIAVDKKVLKQAMVDIAAPVAFVTIAHAAQINDNELLNSVNFSRSELLRIRDDQIAQRCQVIHNQANTHIAALTLLGVNAATLTALQNAINAYAAKSPSPTAARAAKKANSIELRNLFTETDNILKLQLDKVMEQYRATDSAFYNAYKTARVIHDLGATHTRFRMTVKDENSQVIAGATASLLKNNIPVYQQVSDAAGVVKILKIKPGVYDLKVQKLNFTTVTKPGIQFSAGKEVKRTVTLLPGGPVEYITEVREGDVEPGAVVNISNPGFKITPLSTIIIEVSLGPLVFYAAATPTEEPSTGGYERPVGTITLPLPEFAQELGFGDDKELLNIYNPGTIAAHYKLTLTHLEPE